ncbi:MAG: hypothetical protein ACOVOX_05515 [Burkholderiaceae bacterium]
MRKSRTAHAEAADIQKKHGSRKSGLPATATQKRRHAVVDDAQGELF